MATYRLALLGRPALTGPKGPVLLRGPQAQALLWYLAADPSAAFTRRHLAEVLWEGVDERSARPSLSALLFRLRRLLPVWPLRTAGDSIGWDPAADIQVDVPLFGQLSESQDPRDLQAAVHLWRGPFLDGFEPPPSELYDQWLQGERQRWEGKALGTLARLAAAQEQVADWDGLAGSARLALSIDPIQERFHRWLMLALARAGDRAAALSHFGACRQLLHDELGVEPDEATMALRNTLVNTATERPGTEGPTFRRLAKKPTWLPTANPISPATPTLGPLVGRGVELARIDKILSANSADHVPFIFVHGEAGIGKTRLVEEVLQRRKAELATTGTILVGRCHPETEPMALAPLAQLLGRQLFEQDWAAWSRGPLGSVGGLAHHLLSLPTPLLLVMDDIQWADQLTLTLLALLARGEAGPAVTILATGRAGALSPATLNLLRQLEREQRLTWLNVPPLTFAATTELTTAIGGPPSPSLAAQLYARTLGNPLFAIEYLRALGGGDGQGQIDLRRIPVPTSVQSVIAGRLLRLPEAARELTVAAAIFPGAVPFPILQQVAGQAEDVALGALEALTRAGILREIPPVSSPLGDPPDGSPSAGHWTGEVGVGFAHDLIRQAVIEGVSHARQVALHRRAFSAVAAAANLPPRPDAIGTPQPALSTIRTLTLHAAAGNLWEQAVAWGLVGAAAAERAFLLPDKIWFLEQASRCLPVLPATSALKRQANQVRLELAHALLIFRPESTVTEVSPPLAGESPSPMGRSVSPSDVSPPSLDGLPDPRIAKDLATSALADLRQTDDPTLLAVALRTLGMACGRLGDFDGALAALTESLPLDESLGHRLDAAITQMSVAHMHTLRGDFEQARSLARELLAKCRQEGDPTALATVLALEAIQAAATGQWDRVAAAVREATELNKDTGFQRLAFMIRLMEGPLLAVGGDPAAGLTVQAETVALAGRYDTGVWLVTAYVWLGRIRLMVRQIDGAATAARQGLALAKALGDRYDAAVCTHLLGQCHLAAGDTAAAVPLLTEALAVFTSLGASPDAARCQADLDSGTDP